MVRGLVVVAAAGLLGCNDLPDPCLAAPVSTTFHTRVRAVDEAGAPIAGATLTIGADVQTAGADGVAATAELAGPALAIVAAKGYLAEPVPLGWSTADAVVSVRLLSDHGGKRIAIHSAGDVMFGRRYEAPVGGPPLIPKDDAAAGAKAVVSAIAPAFAIADLSTVNLETVVSDRDASAAYPGKRFILRSRPGALAALHTLGVDVASIANNHARDYLDDGVADTTAALTAAGLPIVGAADQADRLRPYLGTVRSTRVAVAAFTTVDGSTVNDAYPLDGVAPPSGLPAKDAWQYEARRWGFTDAAVTIAEQARRIGSAWQVYLMFEGMAAGTPLDAVWGSIAKVYPELQDWVARRGHGGAAPWDFATSPAEIATLASQADVVIVELHAGFQFQEASSTGVRAVAEAAIDAGASIVICHHPHVLQGVEWYRGHLIAYSLGNFVFDQDFLSTFASVFLRTVWEGGALVEARLIPVELESYRPLPATDGAAHATLLRVWERSTLGATAEREADGAVRIVPLQPVANTTTAQLVFEHDTARITSTPPAPRPVALMLAAGETAPIGFDGLLDPTTDPAAGDAIEVGRDLLGWGRFEDELVGDPSHGAAHWNLDTCQEGVVSGDAAAGQGFLRLSRTKSAPVLTRMIARIPLPRHRLYVAGTEGKRALDPDPRYSLHLLARASGEAKALARLEVYHFDDTNPTEDPQSAVLGRVELPLAVPTDGAWHPLDVDLAVDALTGISPDANMVLLYLLLQAPDRNVLCTLDVDQLALIDWRTAAGMPSRYGVFDFVRNLGTTPVALTLSGLPASP